MKFLKYTRHLKEAAKDSEMLCVIKVLLICIVDDEPRPSFSAHL